MTEINSLKEKLICLPLLIIWRPQLTTYTVLLIIKFSSLQSLSHVWLFGIQWTAACQASLPITNSQSLLTLMSIESVMPANHFILCHSLLPPAIFPSIRVFSNESALRIRWPSIRGSASASVLSMNIQDWFPLGRTSLIFQTKGLSRVFSKITVQKHQFFMWCYTALIYSFSYLEPVCCSMLSSVSSWPTYRFLRRQVRWSGIPISLRIFHSVLWSTQSNALA